MTKNEQKKWEASAKNLGAGVADGYALFSDGKRMYGAARFNEALSFDANFAQLEKCAKQARALGFEGEAETTAAK